MCPFGRTPLIPLQLEINESLILHPLPHPLTLLPLRHPTTMSFSVDDLVASLSGNHIGQEALDLAALQVPFISRSLDFGRAGANPQFALSLSSPSPSTAPSKPQPRYITNPVIAIPPWPRHRLHHICRGRRGELAILVTPSWAIEAGAPALLPTLTGPDKIASMRQVSTALIREIAIRMTWMRMSRW
jgi:hypothetical protein